jgi:uncharacterized protein YdcH (DUF465 family)
MDENVDSIVRMFPDFGEKIAFLFQTDENFRDLCADHILCVAMVQEIKQKQNKGTGKLEEYEDLKQCLEQEILQMIAQDKKKGKVSI